MGIVGNWLDIFFIVCTSLGFIECGEFNWLDIVRKVRLVWVSVYVLGSGWLAGWVEVPLGMVRFGVVIEDVVFGWDNEFSVFETFVFVFFIDAMSVTNM